MNMYAVSRVVSAIQCLPRNRHGKLGFKISGEESTYLLIEHTASLSASIIELKEDIAGFDYFSLLYDSINHKSEYKHQLNTVWDLYSDREFLPLMVEISTPKFGTDTFFEKHQMQVKSETQLYLFLFNQMDSRVFFNFEHNGKAYNCTYIDNRVYMAQETEASLTYTVTNLFDLDRTMPGIRIVDFSPIFGHVTPKGVGNYWQNYANHRGKVFNWRNN